MSQIKNIKKFIEVPRSLALLYILNLLDLIFTCFGLQYQHITEANPIMNSVCQINLIFFILFKMVGTLVCILIINILYNEKKWVQYVVFLLNLIYFYIFTLHISILIRL